MGWKLGLLLFSVASSYADLPVEQTLLVEDNDPTIQDQSGQGEINGQVNPLKVRPIFISQSKDPIVATAADERGEKRAELDLLKKSSKFRNVALGSTVIGVQNDEDSEIQNTDGTNPRLPPFAFSGDDVDAGLKSAREIKEPDQIPPNTTPITQSTLFENARLVDTLSEIDSTRLAEEDRTRQLPKDRATPLTIKPIPPFIESIDTVEELSTTTSSATTTASDSELLDPIAEYNRKIVELAKKRRQLKEQGYQKYKQIMFKSGRNIVPVRLFFDTDAGLSFDQTEDSIKRSIPEPRTSVKDDTDLSDNKNFVDATVAEGKKHRPHKAVVAKENKLTELRTRPVIDSESIAAADVTETTTMLSADQILLGGQIETIPEDVDGSGMPEPTTLESASVFQEELLSHRTPPHVPEFTAIKGTSITMSPTDAFSEDITRFDKMVRVKPARVSTITTTSTEQPSEVTSGSRHEQSTEKSITEITTEILDMLGESTTAILPTTSTERSGGPSVIVPIPPDETSAPVTPVNASRTLPPLLSMPALSALSSFSSLSTPVKIATQPRKPKKASVENRVDDRKKSSGILGPKNLLPSRKLRRKLVKNRTKSPTVNIVDSDGQRVVTSSRTRPVGVLERQRFIKQRTIATPSFTKTTRSGLPRTRTTRLPTTYPGRGIGQPSNTAVITKKYPGQRIYERTFRVDQPRRTRIRTKLQRRTTTPRFPTQQGSATDRRSGFDASRNKLQIPLQTQHIAAPPNSAWPIQTMFTQLSVRPHGVNRQPTFGPSHQQIPTVQLSMVRDRSPMVSVTRGPQMPLPQSTITRTLVPPVNSAAEVKIVKPQTNNFARVSRLSEWDRIRAEFLRIKRQQNKLRHRKARTRAVSGVKTLSSEQTQSVTDVERHPQNPHNGEIARGVVWREALPSNEMKALRVDIDRSRHTIDRDVIMQNS
ncbi:hypothetical protein RB195_020891 [Necator americanus]|uniref:Uncharacterized protein n=1 Tax=Necator americanus TaxID=51031 RepID=A0ABR1CL27_NECAM